MAEVDSLDPSLLATGKKARAGASAAAPAPLQSRRRRMLKLAAYAAIFVLSLLFFLLMKIPSGLVTSIAVQKMNELGPYHVQAGSISFRFFLLPHLSFENLEISPRIPGSGSPIQIERLDLYPSPLTVISLVADSKVRGSFSGEAYGARWSGSMGLSKAATDIDIEAEDIDLTKFTPFVESGIAAKGVVQKLAVVLSMEAQRLSRADGELTLKGKNFQVDPASFQTGMPLPILDLGPVDIQAKLTKGKLKIEKAQIGEPARDMEIRAEGEVQLAEPMAFSRMDLKLRLKPADKIKKAIPALEGMLGMVAAKRADGFFATKLSGTLASPGMPTPDP